jgi:segregation and condensation protein A
MTSGDQKLPDMIGAAAGPKNPPANDAGDNFDSGGPDLNLPTSGFVVDLDGFEGPLDLLLGLARKQKVDLTRISILALAEQYMGYIEQAQRIRLEVAADYLVMAAWLAYLKSRLLLPNLGLEDEPTGEELAARLQHQLRRLEAMREASERLMAQNRLGIDVFQRGAPEGIRIVRDSTYVCSMFELLDAYGKQVSKTNVTTFKLRPLTIISIEAAIKRLRDMLGHVPEWSSLETFMPTVTGEGHGVERRSTVASTLAASLELAKEGQLVIRQNKAFGAIFIKGTDRAE